MGMHSDRTKFWLNLDLKHEAVQSIRLEMTPWNPAMSTAREATATYLGSLGYDILRLHGTQVKGTIDGADVNGTAYFQKSLCSSTQCTVVLGCSSLLRWFVFGLVFATCLNDYPQSRSLVRGNAVMSLISL